MSRFDRVPLTIKMALVALPLALVGVLVSSLAVTTYKDHQSPRVVSAVTQNGLTAILGESTTYMPTEGSYTMPTTCPSGYTGTPPNCQPAAGTLPPSGPAGTLPPSGGSTGTNTPPKTSDSQYVAPPTFTKSDSGSCMERLLGAEAYAQFQAGGFQPTGDQIAKASSCFSASISYGSSSNSGQGPYSGSGGPNSGSGSQSGQNQPVFASIAISLPPAFQADSPMVACAKQILGDRFGNQPSPEQAAQVHAKCFANASSGQQIGFIDPNNQAGRGGPLPGVALSSQNPGDKPGAPPQLPP